ncbi:unnamed protein product [Diabrotica balteata]|uniref:Peptidase S1 domain-containing protein n=1 Tax=Diabrotica balteata TaxID=107213 RepID=A0A9N9T9M8_DIABA|nr:unnamed protein product [Diabrotica balteata]
MFTFKILCLLVTILQAFSDVSESKHKHDDDCYKPPKLKDFGDYNPFFSTKGKKREGKYGKKHYEEHNSYLSPWMFLSPPPQYPYEGEQMVNSYQNEPIIYPYRGEQPMYQYEREEPGPVYGRQNEYYQQFPPRFNSDEYTEDEEYVPPKYRENHSREETCGVSFKVTELIVNGDEFEDGTYPWLVALFVLRNNRLNYICGGTLVSHKHIITAGHCIVRNREPTQAKDLMVSLGKCSIKNLPLSDPSVYNIGTVHVHPGYKYLSSDGDISILVLKDNVQYTRLIRPACLWNRDNNLQNIVGINGIVAGWGRNENGTLSMNRPRAVKVPIVSQETCLRSNPQYNSITSQRTFCAGTPDAGPCNGDSGSGLVIERYGKWMLRGIVSLSLSTGVPVNGCDLSFYIVFTDASKYLSWINDIMRE